MQRMPIHTDRKIEWMNMQTGSHMFMVRVETDICMHRVAIEMPGTVPLSEN